MDYEQMLQEAFEKFPKIKDKGERFEIPVLDTMIQGNQTIIKNFAQVCQALRREPKHVLKFLTKELATPADLDQSRAVFKSVLSQRAMQQKLESYVRDYVICGECKRPDTQLSKEDRITFLKCEACGAKYSVKEIK